VGRHASSKEFSGYLGIRRAARVAQKARVVRLRRRLGVDAKTVRKPHRNERAVKAVLEGEPHTQVRRETQRCDCLRTTHLLAL
jgi:hypothetical protein